MSKKESPAVAYAESLAMEGHALMLLAMVLLSSNSYVKGAYYIRKVKKKNKSEKEKKIDFSFIFRPGKVGSRLKSL